MGPALFTLPRGRPASVPMAAPATRSARREAKPERVLVVEDDYLVGTQVESALTDAGYDVVGVAATAEEAVMLAASHHPRLVVMDIRIGGKRDGIDAALEIFRDHGIRCIFASAHQDAEARTRAKPARPLGWLSKPYTMTSLLAVVGRALHDREPS